jgi:hypothetical protein
VAKIGNRKGGSWEEEGRGTKEEIVINFSTYILCVFARESA